MSLYIRVLPSLLNGASMTIQVFALVLIFLFLLSSPCLASPLKPLHYLINLYIWVMRGTPFFN